MHLTIVHHILSYSSRVSEDDLTAGHVDSQSSRISKRFTEAWDQATAPHSAAAGSKCKSARPEGTTTAVSENDGRDPSGLM